MNRNFTFLCLFVCSIGAFAAGTSVQVNGTPRFVRSQARTEVFFQDLKDSYWIDQDRRHNGFMDAFVQASNQKKVVSFTADSSTRQILKVQGVRDPIEPQITEPGVDGGAEERVVKTPAKAKQQEGQK